MEFPVGLSVKICIHLWPISDGKGKALFPESHVLVTLAQA